MGNIKESKWKRAAPYLLFPLWFPLLLVAILLACIFVLPFVVASSVIGWIRSQIYYLLHPGKLFLVVDGHHGWRELITNNVLPTVPANVESIWLDSASSARFRKRVLRDCWTQRPFLARVIRGGIRTRSIHDKLLPFKRRAKIDDQVRVEVTSILRNTIMELQNDTSPTV